MTLWDGEECSEVCIFIKRAIPIKAGFIRVARPAFCTTNQIFFCRFQWKYCVHTCGGYVIALFCRSVSLLVLSTWSRFWSPAHWFFLNIRAIKLLVQQLPRMCLVAIVSTSIANKDSTLSVHLWSWLWKAVCCCFTQVFSYFLDFFCSSSSIFPPGINNELSLWIFILGHRICK